MAAHQTRTVRDLLFLVLNAAIGPQALTVNRCHNTEENRSFCIVAQPLPATVNLSRHVLDLRA